MGADAKAAVPDLVNALQNDSDSWVRGSAAQVLGSMGADAKAAVPDLVNALQHDSDSWVRLSAAQALGSMGADAKAAVPDLVNALQNDSDSSVRSQMQRRLLVSIALSRSGTGNNPLASRVRSSHLGFVCRFKNYPMG